MGGGGLRTRLCRLPGVLDCRLTDDAVVVVATPGTDTRLLRARAQVVCADGGDQRALEVRTAAVGAVGGASRLASVAQGRPGRPLAVAAASAVAMAAMAFLPGPQSVTDGGAPQLAAPAGGDGGGGPAGVATDASPPWRVGTPFGSFSIRAGTGAVAVPGEGGEALPEGLVVVGGGELFGVTGVSAAGTASSRLGSGTAPGEVSAPIVAVPIGPAVPAPLPAAAPAPAPPTEVAIAAPASPGQAPPGGAVRKSVGRKVKEATVSTVAIGAEETTAAKARTSTAATDETGSTAVVTDAPGRSEAAGSPNETGQDKAKLKAEAGVQFR